MAYYSDNAPYLYLAKNSDTEYFLFVIARTHRILVGPGGDNTGTVDTDNIWRNINLTLGGSGSEFESFIVAINPTLEHEFGVNVILDYGGSAPKEMRLAYIDIDDLAPSTTATPQRDAPYIYAEENSNGIIPYILIPLKDNDIPSNGHLMNEVHTPFVFHTIRLDGPSSSGTSGTTYKFNFAGNGVQIDDAKLKGIFHVLVYFDPTIDDVKRRTTVRNRNGVTFLPTQ